MLKNIAGKRGVLTNATIEFWGESEDKVTITSFLKDMGDSVKVNVKKFVGFSEDPIYLFGSNEEEDDEDEDKEEDEEEDEDKKANKLA